MITAVLDPPALKVYETDPAADPRWEQFVASHPDGSIYHHPAWISVLEKEYGQRASHLVCEDHSGNIHSILPLLYTRGFPFKAFGNLTARRLSSLPRTPIAGPLSKSTDATIAILNAAIQRTKADRGLCLQVKTAGRELDDLVDGIVAVPWRVSYVLRLPHRSSGPFRIENSHNRGNVRWAVQKAAKQGIVVRSAVTEADLRKWYTLYLETMRRNVLPARSYRFFLKMWEALHHRNLMRLLLAEDGRHSLVAGSIFLTFGRTISYGFNGSNAQGLALGANDAIHWNAINEACAQGFELFDFGEVPDGKAGLARFKSKWGSEPIRLYRYHYPSTSEPQTNGSRLSGTALAIGEQIWRRLPLSAVAWISNHVYSRLSISLAALPFVDWC